jgi:hypothetical protein
VGVVLSIFGRGRAERFAELLDGASVRRGEDELGELLHTARAVRSVPDPAGATIDPMFRDRLRTRLVSVMEVQGPDHLRDPLHAAPAPSRFRIPRRVVIAGPALAGVLALSGIGAASTGAVPGDSLYGVKRSTESAQLSLASSDVNRGRLFLEFARNRMTEATAVRDDAVAVVRTLEDMDTASRNGTRLLGSAAVGEQDRAPLDIVDGFVLGQRAELTDLLPVLPPQARDRALDSLVLLEQIGARSLELRGSMLCTAGYAEEGGTDDLGPLPQRCAALSAGSIPGVNGLPGPTIGADGLPSGPLPSGTPSLPGLGGAAPTGTGFPTPGFHGPGAPGSPGYEEGEFGPGGLLGTVTGTVGGVVGGLLGPLVDGFPADDPSPGPTPSASPSPTPGLPGPGRILNGR